MRWFRFLLSHSIFASLCAVALCYQTFVLLHIEHSIVLYAFVFFSTLSSYNFYWFLSKYSFGQKLGLKQFLRTNIVYVILFTTAGLGMLYCLFYLPYILTHVAVAIFLTLLYSMPLWPFAWAKYLRKAGLLKTILLASTWAYVTVIIPASSGMAAATTPVVSLWIARFFFVAMLCVIFDRRDIKLDEAHGVHSIATDLSKATLNRLMLLAFLIYQAAGLLFRFYFSDHYQFIVFIITGLAVGWVYLLSLKPRGYFFYYFIVDGLMLFSALATFIASLIAGR